jgi:hypothetical protein
LLAENPRQVTTKKIVQRYQVTEMHHKAGHLEGLAFPEEAIAHPSVSLFKTNPYA